METNIQPIKRSEQLSPLSREHHDGLLFVWKLRQGLANGTDTQTLRDYCNWYGKNHITHHFEQEENILLQYIATDHPLATQLKGEHNDIRELLLLIDHKPEAGTISMLADFISRHIRFEEGTLFTHLEQNLTAAQLDEIWSRLQAAPIISSEWTEPFWTHKK